jgi:hypothetical protein
MTLFDRLFVPGHGMSVRIKQQLLHFARRLIVQACRGGEEAEEGDKKRRPIVLDQQIL